jgi:hypothetical protein
VWLLLVVFSVVIKVAGLLPVFSWVFTLNSLIINTIHFSGLHAIAG